ncbi:MAG TPA: recombinase family protein, partial [Armatimonadota bacterium]
MNLQNTPLQQKKHIRCWDYCRTSNDEWENSDFSSLDAQHECNKAYISSQQQEGFVWTGHAEDGGVSGGTLNRPGMKTLMQAIEAGEVDCVIAYKI